MKMRRRAVGLLVLLWGCAGEDIAAPLDHVGEFAKAGGFPVVIVRSGPAPGAGVPVPVFDNLADAISEVAQGGTIRVLPGSYVVEGVVIDKPVTIQGLGNGRAEIQTSVALSAFFVNGYAAGTVLIDGLTFDFDTPTGPTTATRSYPIRAHGTYDQLLIRNSTFDIDPDARGSIFTEQSTVATAATFVDNVEINRGVFGVAVGDNHTEVTNSHISGTRNGVYYFGTPTPPTGRVEGSVFVDCGNHCVRVGGGGDVDVISNIFGQCRLRRCVTVVNGAQSEVRSNTFAAQVLTGDPADQVVLFTSTTTGVIDNNTFAGCGFDECLFIAGAVTISNNHFTHVAGQTEFEFASILTTVHGVNVTLNNNTIHSCAVFCYKLLDGSTVSIQNDVVTVPAGHGTSAVLVATKDEPGSVNNVIIFADNMVTGVGEAGLAFQASDATVINNSLSINISNPVPSGILAIGGSFLIDGNTITGIGTNSSPASPEERYPMTLAGIEVVDGAVATVSNNTIMNAFQGLQFGHDVTVTGTDNVVNNVEVGIQAFASGNVTITSSDFTNYVRAMDIFTVTQDLKCNWWGTTLGPQNAGAPDPSVFTPWALAPVAGSSITTCTGGIEP